MAKGKNNDIAVAVLAAVGGKENVNTVLHCMTRLRFHLKDDSGIDLEEIKGISGVLGTQFAEGSLHVIIGPAVADVYNELVAIGGFEAQEAVDENIDEGTSNTKKKITVKGVLVGICNTFASCMTPIVPVFVLMGMANVIAALIGPSFLGLVSDTSDLYNNFYYIYQTILYFLPVFVGLAAAKVFKTDQWLALVLVSMLLLPEVITALGSEVGYTVYGISVPNVEYDGQVIPAILIVWILSYVEKFVNKIMPSVLKVIGVPLVTVLIMLPLEFVILGPLGTYIGNIIGQALVALYSVAGPVETTLIGAIAVFATAFGFGRPIFFICLNTLMATGVEYAYMPASMVTVNFVAMAVAVGYAIKSKEENARETGVSCLIASALGGVSEPTLFGIIMTNQKTFLPCIIGGAAGGLVNGIFKVGYYQFGPSNVLSVLGFVSADNSSNLIYGIIGAAVAFVVTLVCMLFMYKDNDKTAKKAAK